MSVMNAPVTVSRVVAALLLAASLGSLAAAAAASSSRARPAEPIVTVVRHGGLCLAGTECRSVLRIGSTISGDGYLPRRLGPRERAALLNAIGKLDIRYLRAHPFTGTCPIAYDGVESVYRFRDFRRPLASCTYDLRGVEAVRLVERLLGTLKPKHR